MTTRRKALNPQQKPLKTKKTMREIKDFIHLYLGCEVFDSFNNSRTSLVGVSDTGVTVAYNTEWKLRFDEVKPILRKISSMTEEEAIEYLKMKYNAVAVIECRKDNSGFWYSLAKGLAETKNPKFIFFGQIKDTSYPEQFVWLLSKGFDLFGLCEAGFAIDKDSLKLN